MAEQSQQNVVAQPQSMDAASSVDVSVNKPLDLAAIAAAAHSQATTNDLTNADSTTLQSTEPISTAGYGESSGDGAIKSIQIAVEGKDNEALEAGSIMSTGVDGSVGSDTDNSKIEANSGAAKEAEGQTPKYSAKKSTSFKPVSVTKNFLAKAGSSSVPAKPIHDRAISSAGTSPAPSSQNALRPRLVAKSVSGQRGSIPKTTGATDKSGPGVGPDPNQVWNKNRVSTPQATPKHLTDEELRQQYGIQLASRPDESDDKGAKWADIDDEEDDWAPETIEWNDGTKINLAQADTSASGTIPNQKDGKDGKVEPAEPSVEATKPTTVGPNATVLKLGASLHSKTSSISNKGLSDKPTLVSKPLTSAPVKSPWATLPAVDKISPVPINPPTQPLTQSRFGVKDPHGFDAMLPPPGAGAKEIAADDFSRFSRDMPNGNPRELYVPQSGRYEPVNESRRGSARKDSGFRPPSVLQRPSHGELQGPAEPSAAFQTNRSQQDSVTWSRRRASSNVSGESGMFARRMSASKSGESPSVVSRRNSQFDPFAPASNQGRGPIRDISPAQSAGKSITSQSPVVSTAAEPILEGPASNQDTSPSEPQEDPVVVQKRLMREKREAAIKRKKEEEEREEAEKRERIRIKMEKLGLTDKGSKKDVAAETPKESVKVAKIEGDDKVKERDSKDSKQGKPGGPLVNSTASAGTEIQHSPPKPPVPSVNGPPQQYGLMKVHAAQPLTPSSLPATLAEKETVDNVADVEPHIPGSQPSLGNSDQKADPVGLPVESLSNESGPEARPWTHLPQVSHPYTNWGPSAGMATHSSPGGNLWGPPTNHRALGNGDFQNNLVPRPSLRPPPPHYSQQHLTSPPPNPIGTPRQTSQARGVNSVNSTEALPRSIIEDSQSIPSFPPTESDSLQLAGHNRNEPRPTSNMPPNMSQPLGISNGASKSLPEQLQTGSAAWANFAQNVGRQDRERAEKVAQEHATRMAEQQLSGIVPRSQLSNVTETWKQVKKGDIHGTRQIVNRTKSQDNFTPASAPHPSIVEHSKAVPGNINPPVRSRYSDFFGQDQLASQNQLLTQRPSSPSAPPPDSLDHPAYGLNRKPLVNLPGSKPLQIEAAARPIVKLPPSNAVYSKHHSPNRTDVSVNFSPARGASQPLVASSSWQDRFDGLFKSKVAMLNKKINNTSGFSASKEPLEIHAIGVPATAVTLPPPDPVQRLREAPVKSVEEENALFEERDFGSVPTTRMPSYFPVDSSWEPAKEPNINPKRAKALALKLDDVTSIAQWSPVYFDHIRGAQLSVLIMIPGMTVAKTKSLARPASRFSGPTRGGKMHTGRQRQGPSRPRDSSQLTSTRTGPSNPSRSQSQTNTIPKSKAQQAPQSTWARNASPTAP